MDSVDLLDLTTREQIYLSRYVWLSTTELREDEVEQATVEIDRSAIWESWLAVISWIIDVKVVCVWSGGVC